MDERRCGLGRSAHNRRPKKNQMGETGRRGASTGRAIAIAVCLLALLAPAAGCQPGEGPVIGDTPVPVIAAGAPAAAGPQAWIENPINGDVLPAGLPVFFVAFATDAQGVARIDLRLNGQPLAAAAGDSAMASNGRNLVRLQYTWQPDSEGEMLMEARGLSEAGEYGEPAYVTFCVGQCQPLTGTPTPAPMATPTPTPAAAPTDTPSPAPLAQYDLQVRRMDFSTDTPGVGEVVDLFIMIATDVYPAAGPFFPQSTFRWRQGPAYPWQTAACPTNTSYARCTLTVQFAYAAPGSYLVEVEADDGQQVAETDEGNNTNSWTVTVTEEPTATLTPTPGPQYDLYVRRMDFNTDTPLVGEVVSMFVMIATDSYPAAGPFFPASSFRWRQGPSYSWQEVACPANSQYASCTQTLQFGYAQPGTYLVEVEADHLLQVVEPNEGNNTLSWTVTVGQAATPSPTPTITPAPTAQVEFWASPPYVNAGSCTTLNWHVEGVQAVYLDEQGQVGVGSKQVCPCSNTTYTLRVVHLDGSSTTHQVTIQVSGTCEQADTSGPTIRSMDLQAQGEYDCQLFGYASIIDPSGVAWATFNYQLDGGDWHSLSMSSGGGDQYGTSQGIGLMMTSGTVQYYVQAGDSLGNSSQSGTESGDYWQCGFD